MTGMIGSTPGIRYVVMDECLFGYILPQCLGTFFYVAQNIKYGNSYPPYMTYVRPTCRPATRKDFEDFRASIPWDYVPVE